ncbi:MAG: ATP-binding cassette domain-containing protein [Nitrospirae bacterium]|nr:ATP-binding cassette domain-containing protein [Nitrospirota bacterium]
MTPDVIEIEDLTRTFGELKAVDGLNLSIAAGEIFGLLGPNGAGKTTTLKMLTTLLRPTRGTARILGFDILAQPVEVRRQIGYIPQERTLDRYLTGREHLRLFADLYHLSPKVARERETFLLDLVDLTDKADGETRNYSGGMKKRLEIACGLMHHPKVLFLDEPTLGLDIQSRSRVWDHIRDLRKTGMTVVLTTNYLDEADLLCDRLAIIDGGKVVVTGTPGRLRQSLEGDIVWFRLEEGSAARGEEVSALLSSFPFVRNVRREDRAFHVRIAPNEPALADLIREFHKAGLGLEAIRYQHPTLEEVFIHYAGHRIKED